MRATCMRGLAACLLMLSFLTAAAFAGRNPWEGKDWRKWSSRDCKRVLEKSPWVKEDTAFDGGTSAWVRVQFLSALPLRQALARRLMLQRKYDKLNAEQRKVIDEEIMAILSADRDKVVIRVEYGRLGLNPPEYGPGSYDANGNYSPGQLISPGGSGLVPQTGDSGVIIRDQAAQVNSIERRPAGRPRKKNGKEWQYELVFPRQADGSPVLTPDQPIFVLLLVGKHGQPRYSFVVSKDLPREMVSRAVNAPDGRYMFEFRPPNMMYHGKLEY